MDELTALIAAHFCLLLLLGIVVGLMCRSRLGEQKVLESVLRENQALRDQFASLVESANDWLQFRRDVEKTQLRQTLTDIGNQAMPNTPLTIHPYSPVDETRDVAMPAHGAP